MRSRIFREARNWILAGAVALFIVASFVSFEIFNLGDALPVNPAAYGHAEWAVLGVLLLVADVVLPIPSSLVMVANGAVFGVVAGAALSVLGRLAAFSAGYLLGARGLRRFARQQEDTTSLLMSDRAWIGIVLTRPIPVLSETAAIMAGAVSLPFGRSLFAAFLGAIPESIVLAAAGTSIYSGNGMWPILISLVVIVALYWIGIHIARAQLRSRVGARHHGHQNGD